MYLESDSVFKVSIPPNSYSIANFKLVRNYGFIWDHRIMGIVAYLFLLLSLVFRPRYFKLDVLLSSVAVLTTTSRGAIVTYAVIFIAYLLQTYGRRFIVAGLVAVVFSVLFFVFI